MTKPGDAEAAWSRRRGIRKVHVVALLSAVVAAGAVFGLFNRFGVPIKSTASERQLIAAVDLRVGNPAGAAERGAAKARADLDAGLLQLQFFAPGPLPKADAAKAKMLQQRYGIRWINKEVGATPLTQAFADAYNRVMQAEIERRHGAGVLAQALPPHVADGLVHSLPPHGDDVPAKEQP